MSGSSNVGMHIDHCLNEDPARLADFETKMNAVIARGGLSHVAFFHQSGLQAPARYARSSATCWVATR